MDGAEAKGGMRRHAAEEVWLVGLTAHVHFHCLPSRDLARQALLFLRKCL